MPLDPSSFDLIHGDCLEKMASIDDGSIDMILTDLPYGVTNRSSEAGSWDEVIPFGPMWDQFLRVTKRNGAIVLFAQGMFSARLMTSMPELWRYNLIWDKCRASGFLNSNRMPLRRHEDILVFYRSLPTYNVQLEDLDGREESHVRGLGKHVNTNRCYGKFKSMETCSVKGKKFPGSILKFSRPHCTGNHPTEKSVELCEWLIKSYTNEGDAVLDATMGSGTTGVACVRTGRRFVGIEKNTVYFDVAKERINRELGMPVQPSLF